MPNNNLSQLLLNFLLQLVPSPDEGIEALLESMEHRKLVHKEHLVMAGEVAQSIVFCANGYFRFYHYLPNGTEVTSDFYFAPNVATSYTSFITRKPSAVYVQAMEDMEVLTIGHEQLMELYHRYPSVERIGRLMAEQVAITSEKHLFSLLNYNAEERYAALMQEHPEFIQQIPLHYIASYLGVTPETLSRIRQRIR
ncbi:MAG TPA: Crp/Fnr family transcriptional regulator [Williamwhitmania sp.]|jgi:CRP-like cAMP-binding protein|nr:Crp/Fnr family transcriptional regulator [Williamwhitmania sp.]